MNATPKSATACRWSARAPGLLLLGVFAVFAVGEHMPIPFTGPVTLVALLGALGFVSLVVGLLAGWRWELTGGILVLAGAALLVYPTLINGRVTLFFAVMAAPGVLFIASRALRRPAVGHLETPPPGQSG